MNLRLFLPVLLLVFLCSQSAEAADDQRTRAGQLFRAGQAAFAQGEHAAAAQSFEQAHQLWPSGSTVYNAGRAWDKAAEPRLAAANYDEALAQVDLSAAQRKHAELRLRDLQTQLVKVQVQGPRDFTVLDAAGTARPLPATVYITPQTKQLTVRDALGATQSLAVDAVAGQSIAKVVVALAPAKPVEPATPPPVAATHQLERLRERPASNATSYLGWAGVGLATVGVAATSIAGLSFLSKRGDFIDGGKTNRSLRDEAVQMGVFTTVGMGVTLVGAGLAAWGFHRTAQARNADVSVTFGPQGFSVWGQF